MSEQQKKTDIRLFVFIAIIIIAAVVIWAIAKVKTNENPQKEQQQEYSQHNHALDQSTEDVEKLVPDMSTSLKSIISAARTWGLGYKSWYGKEAPDFVLNDLQGKEHKLSGYRGKDVLLIFWATWCGPCQREVPHLKELRNSISEDKLAMLAISNEDPSLIKKFAESQKINYTVLLARKSLPEPYKAVNSIPSSFFIDKEGKVKLGTLGLISLEEIKSILQAE